MKTFDDLDGQVRALAEAFYSKKSITEEQWSEAVEVALNEIMIDLLIIKSRLQQ